jgi:hypothetical protein
MERNERTSSNPARTRPAIPALPTKSKPTFRPASNAPTVLLPSKAEKLRTTPNANYLTTSRQAAARGTIKMITIALSARFPLQNGRKNLIARKSSTGKWRVKAAGEHKTVTPPPPKPTLIPKKESRRKEISLEHLSDDDDTPFRAHALCPPATGHLQYRMSYFSEPDSDDDSTTTRNIIYEDSGDEGVIVDPPALALPSPVPLPAPDPSFPAPVHYEDLAEEVATFVASLALPWDHNWQTLNSAPFQVVARGPLLTSIVFADGRSRVMDTAAVDAYLRVTTQTPTPPLQPPPPPLLPPLLQLSPEPVVTRHQSRPSSPLLSPAPSPAFTWQPSWQPARPPTPYHEPASPPTTPILLTPSGHHVPASCPHDRTAIVTAIAVRPRLRPFGAMAPGPS